LLLLAVKCVHQLHLTYIENLVVNGHQVGLKVEIAHYGLVRRSASLEYLGGTSILCQLQAGILQIEI